MYPERNASQSGKYARNIHKLLEIRITYKLQMTSHSKYRHGITSSMLLDGDLGRWQKHTVSCSLCFHLCGVNKLWTIFGYGKGEQRKAIIIIWDASVVGLKKGLSLRFRAPPLQIALFRWGSNPSFSLGSILVWKVSCGVDKVLLWIQVIQRCTAPGDFVCRCACDIVEYGRRLNPYKERRVKKLYVCHWKRRGALKSL